MKAMILAAGRGERLKPLTDICPKPLINIGGKPMVSYHLESLAAIGVTEVVMNICHLADAFRDILGDGHQYGVSIQYSLEHSALETGGGIVKALPLLGEAPFILINGDVYCEYPLSLFLGRKDPLAHLVLVPNPAHNSDGDFSLEKGCVVSKIPSKSCTYSGLAVLSPELFRRAPKGRFALPELFRRPMASMKISGELYQGHWTDVGTIERLHELESRLLHQQSQKRSAEL